MSGISAAIFESAGRRTEHWIPGTYSRSNNVSSAGGVNAGNLVIMGKSTGGEPGKLLSFSTLAEAKETLLGGELLTGVGHAFNGSPDYVPQRVYAMRVNNGTQAEFSLKNNGSEILNLKTSIWGVKGNQVKIKKTTSNGKINIAMSYQGNEVTISGIEKKSLAVLYTGEEESASITVTNTDCVLSAGTDSLTIDFESCEYIADLVSRINEYRNEEGDAVFSANLLDYSASVSTKELDNINGISLSKDDENPTVLKSDLQALIESLETLRYVGSVELAENAARVIPDDNNVYQYFEGATDGDYTVMEWVDALEKLEKENVQIIATPSTDEDVLNLIANHCVTMSSTVNRKERTCILGGKLNETVEQGVTKAAGFNSKYVSYICDTAIAADPLTGKSVTIAPSYLACKIAGAESGMAVNTALTNKTISVLGFVEKRSRTEIETMIKGGIMPCGENEEGNLVVIRAMTTYQSDDLMSCERSMVREDLYMNRELRQRFSPGIGGTGDVSPATIVDELKDIAKTWADQGYIVPDEQGRNVWNIHVTINGDKTYLEFDRYLAAPRNFVFATANNFVYSTSSIEL
ncbi:MAG: phage tail sheath subtilisin-like domain-containing protein [Bacilli bacterium]|nr:phage tail sheath subtilisin-like domain-containing protein [Bacilli bacterium]